MENYVAPGRLGDPNMSLATEPRSHPVLLAALKAYNMDTLSYLTSNLSVDAPMDDITAFAIQNEASLGGLLESLDYTVPNKPPLLIPKNEIIRYGKRIQSSERSDRGINLVIYRPAKFDEDYLPAMVYFHGGGMIILSTDNPMHTTWAEAMARTGIAVVMVDFQNAVTNGGLFPFPVGLNECSVAVQWIHAHREQLKINKIILQGESGGGNLAIATAIKAKQEGWLEGINGICATVPYISGAYGMPLEWKLRELPSLVECDGYLISSGTSALNAKLYDPEGENSRNPLAWPYWASQNDLEGLPPHLIITNELDPLRDEGNAYYRKLLQAGVKAIGKVNLGIVHEGELFLRHFLPDLFLATLSDIKNFIDCV